jgi:hypothetical protein
MTQTGMLTDVVKVGRRFQRAVRVDADVGQASALEGFVCPPSAADALLQMARQVHETGHGAFTWTGPYGAGKSSLAVVLAALLGPDAAVRRRAKEALGREKADQALSLLKPGKRGWTPLPVVGRRGDPEAVIGEALAGLRQGKRGPKGAGDVVSRLRRAAEDEEGAGLLLIIDEMGKFLEQAALGGADLHFFQELAEASAQSNGRLLVVGILHQAFDEYAQRLARESLDGWRKVQGRYVDVPLNVAGEEQIELIARAIDCEVPPPPSMAAIADGVAAAIRRNRSAVANDLGERLLACWPLHPIVASLLGPISKRRFGQNQRSIFGFLNSAEPLGFQDFLRETGRCEQALFTPERLWDYLRANLEGAILASADGHRWSLACEAVERCEARGGDRDHVRLIKVVALVDLFKERSGLLPSLELLALAMPDLAAERVAALLEQLRTWSVVIYRRHLDAYAVYAGSDFDIDAAVAEARSKAVGVDFARLRAVALLHPVLAKRHYHETGALRWFDIDIAPLADGIDRVRKFRPQSDASGLFLLLVGDRGGNDEQARQLCRDAAEAAVGWPVAVGWASQHGPTLRDLAADLLALEVVRSGRPELDGDAVARREVNARIAHTAADLEERVRQAFLTAGWTVNLGSGAPAEVLHAAGPKGLNSIASDLADARYSLSPRLHNELLNRLKPSSNAIAAQKALLKAMVEQAGAPRLGIEGYPAEGGLFASLLENTGLYRLENGASGRFRFSDPPSSDPARLRPLWDAAEAMLRGAGPAGVTMQNLLDRWQAPPFGVRSGLFPIFAMAFALAKIDRVSLYLDGTFRPRADDLLVDRLGQEPASVRLRWSEVSEFHGAVLAGVADAVARASGAPVKQDGSAPLDVARGLVAFVKDLRPWVLKTEQLGEDARRVRDLAKLANDPNKFLLDDVPAVFGGSAGNADAVVRSVHKGLSELVAAYPQMLRGLETVMLTELRVRGRDLADLADLRARADTVRGLTGNYRLDAFAARLAAYTGSEDEIEGIASLAANRPPRDWSDRDIDQARVELAALAQEFTRAEGFARVKGRRDRRFALSLVTSDLESPAPVVAEFDFSANDSAVVDGLAGQLFAVLEQAGASRDLCLAAIAQIGARLAAPSGHLPDTRRPEARQAVRRRKAL